MCACVSMYQVRVYISKIFSDTFWTVLENYYGQSDPIHMKASCKCSLGAWKATSPLVGSRCTMLVQFLGKVLETITSKYFQPLIGLLQPFIIIYKELKFFFYTYICKSLIWASGCQSYMCPKWTKWCPDCSRIVPTQHKELLVLTHALRLDWSKSKITKRLGKLMH